MQSIQLVTIQSLKYDRSCHRKWTAKFIASSGSLLEFVGEFENEVSHPHLGIIRPGTISYEYYWLDRWYNVFRFHEPVGTLRNYYCNVNMPPVYMNNVLEYVDLDIDIVVWRDHSYEVLDLDEFEENAVKFGYGGSLKIRAYDVVEELKRLIETREFPFDH